MAFKIATIISSGGATFKFVYLLLKRIGVKHEFIVITDRECGIKEFCYNNNIQLVTIYEQDNRLFSKKAKEYLDTTEDIKFIILFFTRLITEELFKFYPCFNIHPAILPAFKGLSPIKDAIRSGVKFFGTTLHMVDETMDGGQILAQTIYPIVNSDNEYRLERYAYIQKIYLFLLLIDLFETNSIENVNGEYYIVDKNIEVSERCNPKIINKNYLEQILKYQKELNVEVIK